MLFDIPGKAAKQPAEKKPPAITKAALRLPRWNRQWLNAQLQKPPVLYSVCGAIVLATLVFLFLPMGPPPVTVEIVPNDAVVQVAGKPALLDHGKLEVALRPKDSLRIHAEHEGFVPLEATYSLESLRSQDFDIAWNLCIPFPMRWSPARMRTKGCSVCPIGSRSAFWTKRTCHWKWY